MESAQRLKEENAGTTLANSLAIQLRTAILKGEIAPGERLHLSELKARFGISFSPLREALTGLAAEGLVVAAGQRGFHVAPVSEANLNELIHLRCMAETTAIRESIRLGDEHWEDALVAAHHRLSRVAAAPPAAATQQAWEAAHRNYHSALVAACRMPLLIKFCNTLHDLSDRYRRLFLTQAPRDKKVPGEHLKLYEASLARDADKAAAILEAHIRRTGENVQRAITQVQLPDNGATRKSTVRARGPALEEK